MKYKGFSEEEEDYYAYVDKDLIKFNLPCDKEMRDKILTDLLHKSKEFCEKQVREEDIQSIKED